MSTPILQGLLSPLLITAAFSSGSPPTPPVFSMKPGTSVYIFNGGVVRAYTVPSDLIFEPEVTSPLGSQDVIAL